MIRILLSRTLFLFFCFFFCLSPSPTLAGDYDWRTEGQPISEHFDTVAISGNPQNFDMVQDEKGYIYIANGAGILIYNGNDWQHLSPEKEQPHFALALGDDGRIYTGMMNDFGYYEADKKGQWKFFSLSNKLEDKSTIKRTRHIFTVGSDIIYLIEKHLIHYDSKSGQLWVKEDLDPAHYSIIDNNIFISGFSKKNYKYSLVNKELTIDERFNHLNIIFYQEILPLSNNKHLMNSTKRLFLTNSSGHFERFHTDIDSLIHSHGIIDIDVLSNNNIIIAIRGQGIAIIDTNGKMVRRFTAQHGLQSNQVSKILIDEQNTYWFSYYTDGVSRIELSSPISQYSSNKSLSLSTSTSYFNDRIFAGSVSGLYVLKPAITAEGQSSFKNIKLELEEPHSLIQYFLVDRNEMIIAFHFGISILRFGAEDNNIVKYVHDGDKYQGWGVKKLIRSKRNINTIYAISANGLIKLEKINGEWQSRGLLPSFDKRLISIAQDNHHNLWLGTVDSGEFYRVGQLDQWPNVKIEKIESGGYTDIPITDGMLLNLHNSLLFSNSMDEPIKRLSINEKNITEDSIYSVPEIPFPHFIASHKIDDNSAWVTTQDKNTGRNQVAKISTNDGIHFEVDFSDFDHLNLQFAHGIYQSEEGDIWINSLNKIIRKRTTPDKEANADLKLPLITKVLEIGSNQQLFNNTPFQYSEPHIRLTKEENNVDIQFNAVDFVHNSTIEYRHKLNEINSNWSNWSTDSNAVFTNLPPGQLTFDLQYRTNPNQLSPISHIKINRAPYWYQIRWVQLAILLISILLILLITHFYSRYKNRKLQLQAKSLETLVDARTKEVTEQNKKLRTMDEAKNRFFSNVSHEFRTPLTLAIGPLAEVLRNNQISDKDDRQHIEMALKNNQHMMSLIGQVLDINRLESGEMPLKIIHLDVINTLNYCIERFDFQAQKRDITFNKIGFNQAYSFYFDADHFEKILLNLLSNALKYSPLSSSIDVGISQQNNQLKIWVKDQGTGISQEEQKHIFERYYQGKQSPNTIQPGTGIGLSLVKDLVHLHKGEIQLESTLNQGTQFSIYLLLGKEHYAAKYLTDISNIQFPLSERARSEEVNLTQNYHSEAVITGHKKTVLIIDDNNELLIFISSILSPIYQIIQASDGKVGFQLALEKQPDVIVSDIMMPVMDGLQLAEKLKASIETMHIPLILLTAKSTQKDVVEGLQQGADDYLSKPFDTPELIARIAAQILQKQRLATALFEQYKTKSSKFDNTTPINQPKTESEFVLKVKSVIREKLGNVDFGVNQLAKDLHMEPRTFGRHFKKEFKITPSVFISQQRVCVGLEMLQAEKGNISEIAYACGFDSLSYFSRSFGRHFGVPPTQYKTIDKIAEQI